MEEVYHCPAYLMSHPLAKTYGSTLYDLAEKDYPGKHYFRGYEIPTIDLDRYEEDLNLSQEDCTSDAVVGIATLSGVSLRKKRLLLTEVRL
ncbi:MAG: hypothetical protein K2H60_04890 [Muribaculaceae bacterium]|nr:hypothetical protein [Muribaculaceae bacterium]